MGRLAEFAGDEGSDGRSRTFVFEDEDHTLGNILVGIIRTNPAVDFCSYVVPHPAESKMQIRIQMGPGKGRALEALKRGLQELEQVCDHVTKTFEQACDNAPFSVE